jgi:hypothetical protein
MTGIAEDHDAAFDLVNEALKKLQEKDPQHELLQYMKMCYGDEKYKAFEERFGKKGLTEEQRECQEAETYTLAQYFVALRKALGEEPAPPQAEAVAVRDEENEKLPF